MTSRLNPYLGFRDTAREAMEFYRAVFGGELTVSTFADLGQADDPVEGAKVMHAQLEAPDGFVLMAADTPSAMDRTPGGNVAISLSGDDVAGLTGWWEKLSVGGVVAHPLGPSPWGDLFGMCRDRFGVSWMVYITGAAG
ncbi:VOC family protein [Sanguibacter antarcticus]|uniref:PhnB protein n=1 Tax=Sanguibacter antarcticus TaxID=372484 RepID=A0A2A9E4T4_9MICO|nr:VOC family protein [Sanguibacter antarcticus]PFG33200.1 PhnB protein [Sanguibacter antarcticus]